MVVGRGGRMDGLLGRWVCFEGERDKKGDKREREREKGIRMELVMQKQKR